MHPAPERVLLGEVFMKRGSIDTVATGQKLHDLRVEKGYSVKALSDYFDFTGPQSIYRWERGLAIPSIDNLVILSDVFGITINDILVLSEDKK